MARSDPPKRGEAKVNPGMSSVAIALACLLAMLGTWEGTSLTPYKDVIGVPTVCTGETNVEMRRYTQAECDAMLKKRAAEFLEAVRTINPAIADDPYQWAAHTDLAYNVGVGNYSRSRTLRLYKQGRKRDACDAMGSWVLAGGRPWKGLILRRNGDAARLGDIELCKKGMAA